MEKRNWRYLLFLLASHHPKEKLDHTIRLGFRGKNVYLCSRCTGVALGMIAIFTAALLGRTLPLVFYLPLIALLPLVAVADWFTQSAKRRESKTWIRLTSGFLLGNSEALVLLLLIGGFYLQFLFALGAVAVYALSMYLIALKTKCLDEYLREMNQIQIPTEPVN
jgi:uncharacterized membrane protein